MQLPEKYKENFDISSEKKIPVGPVSYREKIRVGRSEIIFFLNIFFMFFPNN